MSPALHGRSPLSRGAPVTPPIAAPLLLRLAEAARRCAVSSRFLRYEIAAGRIAVIRLGPRTLRIEEAELARFIAGRKEIAR